jgi:glycosyltransferase involved in cell wall biosynthesis
MNIKIDFAVCGRFHYHKYLKYLSLRNILNTFYCSYKINYDFGVRKKEIKNYFLKEYLMYFNIVILKKWNLRNNIRFLHKLWERQVLMNKPEADILHVLIHGTSISIINKYKAAGKIVVGEVVNCFPDHYNLLMQKEYAKYGLKFIVNNYETTRIKREIELCDYILVPSSFLRESFIAYGIPEHKIIYIPYGIDENNEQYNQKKRNSEKIKVLSVGQITFRKGQVYLIKAIESLKQKGYSIDLTIIGYLDPLYKKVLKDLKLEDKFIHIPHCNNSEIIRKMNKYDIFVLPSIEDGFGVVVSEAISAGLPAIVSKNAGASELINHGTNGFIIEAGSSSSIENAILDSLNKDFILRSIKFNWRNYAEELERNYLEILKGKSNKTES